METAAVGGRRWVLQQLGERREIRLGSLPLTERTGWTRVGRGCHSSAPPESCLPIPFSFDNSRPRQVSFTLCGYQVLGSSPGEGAGRW